MKKLEVSDLLIIALIFIGICLVVARVKGHMRVMKHIDSHEYVEVDNDKP